MQNRSLGRRAGEGRVVNRPEDFFVRLVRLPGCRRLTHLGSLFPLTDGQSAPNRYFLKSTLHPKPRPEPLPAEPPKMIEGPKAGLFDFEP